MTFSRYLCFCLTLLQLAISSPALGDELKTQTEAGTDVRERLIEIDKKVMLECVELARFSINFRETANKHWRWRAILYPIAQEGGTACSFSNSIIDLNERIRGYDDTSLKSQPALKRGEVTSLIGSCISGGSSAAELSQNLLVDWLARRKGYSPSSRIKFVRQTVASIDAKLSSRAELLASSQLDVTDRKVRVAEGQLLQHIRNQLLVEFRKTSTRSQESMCLENTSFAIDATQNLAQVASSIVSLKAFRRPQLDGGSLIVSLSAGVLAALNPTLSWASGVAARKLHRHQLNKAFGPMPDSEENFAEELTEVKILAVNDPEGIDIKEMAFLEENSTRLDAVVDKEIRKITKLRRVAAQQAISGPVIGMTSVSKSILGTIGFYGYRDEPLIRNRIGLAGRITSLAGQSYSLVKTPTTQIHSFINRRRLEREGKLPEQIAQKQLDRLDKVTAQIKALHP